jgi:rubrerythrin
MRRSLSVIALSATLVGLALGRSEAAPTKTIADLKAAYLGETTAHAKYVAYARKADQERYRAAAQLFRAAAAAEAVHAANHKRVLADLGVANPKAGGFTKPTETTSANLKDALKGETYEKDTMYPAMIANATAAGQAEALQSLSYAIAAERQHAALYASALKELSRSTPGTVYYVCPVCGATFRKSAPAVCPVCATPRAEFRTVR